MGELTSFSDLASEYAGYSNPNYDFLESTLLQKRYQRRRKGVTYFSCRGWRKDLRNIQLNSLRSLKKFPDEIPIRKIAIQISELAKNITNGEPYRAVVPVPSGSSGKERNFASILAAYVADELRAPCENILEGRIDGPHSRSSHPMQSRRFNVRFRPGGENRGLVLLIDDVATTGTHFSRCVSCLRRHGYSAVCVSWVS